MVYGMMVVSTLCFLFSLATTVFSAENSDFITLLLQEHGEPAVFDFEHNMDKFENQAHVEDFLSHTDQLLEKNVTFNLRDPSTVEQTVLIFELLFFTKDTDTLFEVAKALKARMNVEQFNYVLAAVLIHRPDMNVEIPPWYQISPNYFIKQERWQKMIETGSSGVDSVTILQLYTEEDFVAYFKEDLDLNNFYYNWMLHYPTWMNPAKYGLPKSARRGEVFSTMVNLLSQRYALELYANLDARNTAIDLELKKGYDPDLKNNVGQLMTPRPSLMAVTPSHKPEHLENANKLTSLLNCGEIIINETYTLKMRDFGETELARLADLLFNTTDSPAGSKFRSILDIAVDISSRLGTKGDTMAAGGVVGYPMAALRDHAYFRILRTLRKHFESYQIKHNLATRKEDVLMIGVSFDDIEVDRLVTYTDYSYLNMGERFGDGVQYIYQQHQLNHEPFEVRMNITNSNNYDIPGVVRLFFAPSSQPFPGIDGVVEVDRFLVYLTVGVNHITRKSKQFAFFKDSKSGPGESFKEGCGLPQRVLVPRGGANSAIWLLALVNHPLRPGGVFHPSEYNPCEDPGSFDNRTFGFPIISADESYGIFKSWDLPNMEKVLIKISHR